MKSEELALNLEEANGEVDELKNTVGRKDAEIANSVSWTPYSRRICRSSLVIWFCGWCSLRWRQMIRDCSHKQEMPQKILVRWGLTRISKGWRPLWFERNSSAEGRSHQRMRKVILQNQLSKRNPNALVLNSFFVEQCLWWWVESWFKEGLIASNSARIMDFDKKLKYEEEQQVVIDLQETGWKSEWSDQ